MRRGSCAVDCRLQEEMNPQNNCNHVFHPTPLIRHCLLSLSAEHLNLTPWQEAAVSSACLPPSSGLGLPSSLLAIFLRIFVLIYLLPTVLETRLSFLGSLVQLLPGPDLYLSINLFFFLLCVCLWCMYICDTWVWRLEFDVTVFLDFSPPCKLRQSLLLESRAHLFCYAD